MKIEHNDCGTGQMSAFKEEFMQPSVHLTMILRILLPCSLIACSAIPAAADSYIFNFVGTNEDGPVNGTAILTVNAGSNQIGLVLTNNLANIRSIGQAISGFSFDVKDASGAPLGIGPITLLSQSGREVSFNNSTTGADVGATSAPDPMGWGLAGQFNRVYLTAFGLTNSPDELILGPASSSTLDTVTYGNANGSITVSDPHQPLVVQTASFSLTAATNWLSSWQPTNATMFFGTRPTSLGATSECSPASPCGPQDVVVPEPNSLVLVAMGLTAIGWFRSSRKAT